MRSARLAKKAGRSCRFPWRRLPCGHRSFAGSYANAMEEDGWTFRSYCILVGNSGAGASGLAAPLRIALPLHIGLTFPDLRDEPRGGSRHPDLGRNARAICTAYQLVTTLCSVAHLRPVSGGLPGATRKPAGEILSDDDRKLDRPGMVGRFSDRMSPPSFAVCMLAPGAVGLSGGGRFASRSKLPKVVFSHSEQFLPSRVTWAGRYSDVYVAGLTRRWCSCSWFSMARPRMRFWSWVSFIGWSAAAAVYQICRNVGASRFAAWTATALALLHAHADRCKASSEGDDIIAATARSCWR